jgi:hypothetical protein
MVYFLQPTDGGPIKIGYTDNLDQRRLQLQVHYGTSLALLATMEGGKEVERAIHERFAAHRIGRTEQFRPAPELLAFIGRPLLANPNPEAVEALTPHNLSPHNRRLVSFRFSDVALRLLDTLAERWGLTRTSVLELLLRQEAERSLGERREPPQKNQPERPSR